MDQNYTRILGVLAALCFVSFGLALALGAEPTVQAFTTTITTTVYAQNFPTTATVTSVTLLVLYMFIPPMILVRLFYQEGAGDVIVTLWLIGELIGGLFGGLSANYNVISPGYVPWGLTFFVAVALAVWAIKGGGH